MIILGERCIVIRFLDRNLKRRKFVCIMKWSDVVGHTETKARLIKAVNEGRIPHAQLILGKEGSGNLPLARAYIQYVLCTNRTENDSCGVCASCSKVSQMSHPDVHFAFPVISKSSSEPTTSSEKMTEFRKAMLADPYMSYAQWVEFVSKETKMAIINTKQCDEIAQMLRLKPYEANYKFMVIWLPEVIHHSAAPKLLKIIEEPPAHTIFLLVSHNDEQILSTIKSRTQLIRLKQIPDFEMMEGLMSRLRIPLDKAREIINIADGNFTLALELAEYNEDQEQNLSWFIEWVKACYLLDITMLMNLSNTLHDLRKDKQKSFFVFTLHIMREALVLHFNKDLLRSTEKEFNFIMKLSNVVHEQNIDKLTDLINQAIYSIDRNASFKMLFMHLSLEFFSLMKARQPEANV